MTKMDSDTVPRPEPQFGYFMLQACAGARDPDPVISVILEDLGTGEKHRFDTPDAVAAFLANWARPYSKRSQS